MRDTPGTTALARSSIKMRRSRSATLSRTHRWPCSRAININSARCAHFNINVADVAAAKQPTFLEDGALARLSGTRSPTAPVSRRRASMSTMTSSLKSAADGALVHSYSDYSGQCGQIAINASIVDDAIKFQPSLQRGGCLTNGFFFSNGVVSENKDNLNFDVEYFRERLASPSSSVVSMTTRRSGAGRSTIRALARGAQRSWSSSAPATCSGTSRPICSSSATWRAWLLTFSTSLSRVSS